MKISIVTPNFSNNCLGRAHLLADILNRSFKVEIVGPMFGESIWEPLKNNLNYECKYEKITKVPKSYIDIFNVINKIDGDVIYCSKPLFPSYGISLLKKSINDIPLILDIDDWDFGFLKKKINQNSFFKSYLYEIYKTTHFHTPGSYFCTYLCELLSNKADHITVSNEFLKNKFGGTLIPHSRDEEIFDPKSYNKNSLKRNFGINPNKNVVMFFGTPRPHRGVEDLILAVKKIKDENLKLVIVGMNKNNNYCNKLKNFGEKQIGNKLLTFGLQPFDKVPEFLSVADIMVVPQRKNVSTYGQIPVKLIDAMAMGKPIISTDVSDIPKILKGCGILVEPGDPTKISEGIKFLLDDPDKAKLMGKRARERFLKNYSYNAMHEKLKNIFEKYK